MRLAIIADIHGNADALNAVLTDVRQQGVDRLIVNGDVVNRGPDSVEVMETLLDWPDVSFSLGNHDDLLRLWDARSGQLPLDWFADPVWGATDWSARQLDAAGLLHVPDQWPMVLTVSQPGMPDVRIAHGTADHYRESLSERTPVARVQVLRSQGAGEAGVLVGSHIHRPAQAIIDGTLVLNTGAVGAPANRDPRAQYLMLSASAQGWIPEFRAIPYDRQGVLRRFETSGLLDTGLSAQIFRDEVISARSLYTPFWQWTEEGNHPRTPATWALFLRQFE
ncbi:fructose-bisphosphatase class III [Deinococcus deserti]|uniref:Putative Metallophosphoesterase n=1 Tax=Deinococcus deserti (strain DSM 17065 / CIP 109153 / LMG 22923 / VCD115) TaxID=546414 RepID=C1CW96_DEIDV|nr:fructose-bisphosphatase class III [Deinococcus deserti]ACO46463.1 putative Metallophosphoesterase [Deinococcus deserti VCD115]